MYSSAIIAPCTTRSTVPLPAKVRLYYKPPTLRPPPTPQTRGLNLKGPSPRPRGRGKWRPLGKKTQPTATASTGGKKVICGRNAQKYQKCSVGKCPSGARRNRSTGGLNRNYIALNVWWRAAASNLEERPKTAENGRIWRFLICRGQCTRKPCFCTFFWIPEAAWFLVFVFLVYLGVAWRRRVFP